MIVIWLKKTCTYVLSITQKSLQDLVIIGQQNKDSKNN